MVGEWKYSKSEINGDGIVNKEDDRCVNNFFLLLLSWGDGLVSVDTYSFEGVMRGGSG